ncbi:MAG: family 43 glycosylhydrolase [Promethearchaeota archaeon]
MTVRTRFPKFSCFMLIIYFTMIGFVFLAVLPRNSSSAENGLQLQDIHIRDPNIFFFNGTYYMTGTTALDGFLGYSSRDLEHWNYEGYIYRKNDSNYWAQQLFWAPEVVVRNGTFYMFFTANSTTRKRATGVAVAEKPLGPYHDLSPEPLTPPEWQCLDGHLFKDTDGKEYLIYVHEWLDSGTGEMWVQQVNENYTSLIGEKHLLFRGGDATWSNNVVDGPSMIHVNGIYYLFWSSFNGGSGYCCGYAQSRELFGPYIQSSYPVITGDGGHSTWFRENGTGKLLITYHRPNSNGLERPEIKSLYLINGRWTVKKDLYVTPSLSFPSLILVVLLIFSLVLYLKTSSFTNRNSKSRGVIV